MTAPEVTLSTVMAEAETRALLPDLTADDLLKICTTIEGFNQMMGLPSLRWDDALRVANMDRGRQ